MKTEELITKKGIGKSGVHLRYHAHEEYKTLNKAQKEELHEWRASTGKKGKPQQKWKKGKTDNVKAMASVVEKKVATKLKAIEDDKAQAAEAEAFIMSIIQKHTAMETTGARISGVTLPPQSTTNTACQRIEVHPQSSQE